VEVDNVAAEVFLLLLVIGVVFVATRLGALGDALGAAMGSLIGSDRKDEKDSDDA